MMGGILLLITLPLFAGPEPTPTSNVPFVYDLIDNLQDAREFHCPALRLCEVKELTKWTSPEKPPGKRYFRCSTDFFVGSDLEQQRFELWHGNERIPRLENPDEDSPLPFWTFDYAHLKGLCMYKRFDASDCEIIPVKGFTGNAEVEIFAYGTPADDKWPILWVMLNGRQRQEQEINSTISRLYRFPFTFSGGISNLQVCFVNDFQQMGRGDRNIILNWAKLIPASRIDLYVESPTSSATEGITLRSLPSHLSFALGDHPDSLFPFRPESEVSPQSSLEAEINADGEVRRSLFLPGPSRLAYPMRIPTGAILEFAVTVAHGYAESLRWGHGMVRWTWESQNGEKTVLFERFFDPEHQVRERRWVPFEIGLECCAGQEGLLVLETENGFPGRSGISAGLRDDRFQGIRVAHPRLHSARREPEQRLSSHPNVVIISIDTLRADHVGCYGYHRDTTPHLDRLASEGVLFEEAHSPASWTLPAHVSLFCSLYPSTHSIHEKGGRIASDYTQLGEWFLRRGYRTGAFVDGGGLSHVYGYARGFDVYQDRTIGIARILPHALEWWTAQPSGYPRLMFIHFYDVHDPYGNAEEYRKLFHPQPDYHRLPDFFSATLEFRESVERGDQILIDEDIAHLLALYDGDLFYSDEKLGGFFDTLRGRGEWDSTLVVVLSDHGEEFLEHGSLFHGHTVYQELLHVPLVVKFPKGEWAGTRVKELASLIDILPTLADWMGEEPASEWQGQSLIPLISGGDEQREAIYGEREGEFKKIAPDFHLIVYPEPASSDKRPELYDARFDPAEQFDLFDEAGPWAGEEASLVHDIRSRLMDESIGADQRSLTDPELEEQLKALGYVR
jgi:arylsulfatase A-like enzyme